MELNTTIRFLTEVKFNYKYLNRNLICYKRENIIKFNGRIESDIIQGICYKEDLKLLPNYDIINHPFLKLYKKEILEKLRTNPFDLNICNEYLIKYPYSYLNQHKDDSILLNVDSYTSKVYDCYNKEIPIAKVFSLYDGINENYINIKDSLNILKNRKDIVILKNDKGNEIHCLNNNERFLKFIWCPLEEDYTKVTKAKNSFDRKNIIFFDILKLKRNK